MSLLNYFQKYQAALQRGTDKHESVNRYQLLIGGLRFDTESAPGLFSANLDIAYGCRQGVGLGQTWSLLNLQVKSIFLLLEHYQVQNIYLSCYNYIIP